MASSSRPALASKKLEPVDEAGQVAFALGHRKSAGRECHAGHRVASQGARLVGVLNAEGLKQVLDCRPVGVLDIADGEVLVWCETELALMTLGDCAEAGLHAHVAKVSDTAVLDEQRVVPAPVLVARPAVNVAVAGERIPARCAKPDAGTGLDLVAKPVEAAIVDRVLQTRVLSIAAVAEVTLRRHYRFANGDMVVDTTEAEYISQGAGKSPARRVTYPCRRRR